LKLFFNFVDSGDVLKGHSIFILCEQFRAAFSKAHRLAASDLNLPHEKDEHQENDDDRKPVDK
jgi:hypothetical protein